MAYRRRRETPVPLFRNIDLGMAFADRCNRRTASCHTIDAVMNCLASAMTPCKFLINGGITMISESGKRRLRRSLSRLDWKFIGAGLAVGLLVCITLFYGR
ncbi:hypothetical protein [Sphingosinicella sp. BN140058]|uniref:hypothetical protein n=1 Tax=Sphingosinicella sp. BN140058 TaxID=1892855 RepID=UPI0013EBD2EF|nr:hypothetical protein [Sphingosinicella sp. BN140058]